MSSTVPRSSQKLFLSEQKRDIHSSGTRIVPISISDILVIATKILQFVLRRTPKHRITKLYALIREWFDYIDSNLEAGLNEGKLNNLERRIDEYMRDYNLGRCVLYFSPRFRRRFLKEMGIKKELLDEVDVFEGYARAKGTRIDLQLYWWTIRGNFYVFYGRYRSREKPFSFADVEIPLRILKTYFNIKEGEY